MKPSKKLYAHFTILCLAVVCKFLGDFRKYLAGDSFSQRIEKLREIRNFEDLM